MYGRILKYFKIGQVTKVVDPPVHNAGGSLLLARSRQPCSKLTGKQTKKLLRGQRERIRLFGLIGHPFVKGLLY